MQPSRIALRLRARAQSRCSFAQQYSSVGPIAPLRRRPLGASTLHPQHQSVRHASSSSHTASSRLTNLLLSGVALLAAGGGYLYLTDTRAGAHSWLIPRTLRFLYPDAEDAHEAGNKALRLLYTWGLNPRERPSASGAGSATPDLTVEVFGERLSNPIGTSAGIDKHAEIVDPLFAFGPAIVEVGGATPMPQDGNPRPRVFRIPTQTALINRYGLNSEGADFIAMRLRQRVREFAFAYGYGMDEEGERAVLDGEAGVPPGSLVPGRLLAVQVAKNKFTPDDDIDAVRDDYVYCVDRLARYADILVVNVSSPNTPGLRGLQRVEPLTHILRGVVEAAHRADRKKKVAVMVKVSPDEDSDEQILGICDAVWSSGVDGVIVGNTTKRRPDPIPERKPLTATEARVMLEQGGYSGPQLFDRTVSLVQRYRTFLDEGMRQPDGASESDSKPDTRKVIFATGGITNGKQALEVLKAGASVAMVYTALVYGGAGTITRMKDELQTELQQSKTS